MREMKLIRLSRLKVVVLIVVFLISATANSENSEELSVKTILEKVAEKYSEMESYQDWGIVETEVKRVTFETYFIRPNMFRFRWKSDFIAKGKIFYSTYNMIWSNDKGAYTLHDYDKPDSEIEKEENIRMAIAGATGISSGAAYKIAGLLMDEPDDWLVSNPNVPEVIGIDKICDYNCYHIKDIHPRTNTEYHLWIDTHSFLVHRVKEIFPDFVDETNYCHIVVNEDINLDVFDVHRK